jgi:hypothetical protein
MGRKKTRLNDLTIPQNVYDRYLKNTPMRPAMKRISGMDIERPSGPVKFESSILTPTRILSKKKE